MFENTVGCGLSVLGGGRGGDAWRAVVVIDLNDEGWVRMSLLIDVLMLSVWYGYGYGMDDAMGQESSPFD